MAYCTACGQPIPAGSQFCIHCGTQISPDTPPPTPPVAAYTPVPSAVTPVSGSAPPPPPVPIAGPSTSHTLRNIILAVVGVICIIVALGIGGAVYVGIKVKQKATSIAAKVASSTSAHSHNPAHASDANDSSDSAEKMLNGLANLLQGNRAAKDGNEGPSVSPNDPVVPCAPAAMPSQDGARIPLRKGTVVTTAWGIKKGDVEVQNMVTGVDATGFTDTASNGAYVDDNGANIVGQTAKNTVCNEDLLKASNFSATTGIRIPQIVHGLTRLRLSDKIFQEIRATGHTHLTDEEFVPGNQGRDVTMFYGGDLVWTERQDVAYPLIVNDQRVTVPAIHLTGTFDPNAVPTEFYVLDDPLDPLVLLYKMTAPQYHGGRFRIELIRVNFEVINPINMVEKQLTEQKRAVTYGIYFDFNKDTIKPESEPVLKQIVQAMTDNPTWKLTVEGHTDNIGGNDYNLDLSKRRAAAVKRTLVERYHIDPERLQTNGFGASRPVDTNDTLEGRARNRRVELTRE